MVRTVPVLQKRLNSNMTNFSMMLHIEDYEKPEGMAILVVEFSRDDTKLERFLAKNQL